MQQQTRNDWTGGMGPPVVDGGVYESPANFRYTTGTTHSMASWHNHHHHHHQLHHQQIPMDNGADYQVAMLGTHPHKSTSTASTVSWPSDSSSPSHNINVSNNSVSTVSSGSSKKCVDKGSDEYKKRRERNNVAVRKSREKAKMRSRETERRVAELSKENQFYRAQYEELKREFNVLKSLLLKTGLTEQVIEEEAQRINTTSVTMNGLTSNSVINIEPNDSWANGPHAYLEEWTDQ